MKKGIFPFSIITLKNLPTGKSLYSITDKNILYSNISFVNQIIENKRIYMSLGVGLHHHLPAFLITQEVIKIILFIFLTTLIIQSQTSFVKKSRPLASLKPFYSLFCILTLKIPKRRNAILGGNNNLRPTIHISFFDPYTKYTLTPIYVQR